jgi:hypothetical protein
MNPFSDADLNSASGPFNSINYLIDQALARIETVCRAKVISCSNSGSLSPIGTVVVQPMVSVQNGAGVASPHGYINNVVYSRWTGGANAIIMDPVAGDVGLLLVCSRDTSAVNATGAPANPGSFRKFDRADGVFFPAGLSGVPTQWVQFIGNKLTANAVTELDLQIGGMTILAVTGAGVNITGTLTVSGDAHISGRDFLTHEHTGVQSGSSNTGGVV